MAKTLKISTAIALGIATLATSAPALAHGRHHQQGYGNVYDDGYYRRAGYDDGYYRNARDDRRDRSYRNRGCSKGTTGLIVGGVVGGLLGRAVVGRYGDRTAGTIIGAGVGALGGRAIDKSDDRRC